MPGVSYYQVLGVEPDATPAAIKAAWRQATDKFEPGQRSGQFRLFNEAADVLLDPDRRAEYDEEIGAGAPGAASAPVRVEKESAAPRAMTATTTATAVADLPVTRTLTQAGHEARGRRGRTQRQSDAAPGVPAWTIAMLSVLLVAALIVGGVFTLNNHQQSQVQDAGDSASAAAQRALPVILSYDYRHLQADRNQAVRFMTPRYKREYTTTFDKLITSSDSRPGPAVQTKAVVRASVENVGVVSAQTDRVRVIAFLNQTTAKGSTAPELSLNRLTVTMAKSGNAWLVENITSY